MLRVPILFTVLAVGLPVFVSRTNAAALHSKDSDAVAITTFIYHPYSEGYRQSNNEESHAKDAYSAQSDKQPYSETVEYIDYFQRSPQSESLDRVYSGDSSRDNKYERMQTTMYEDAPAYVDYSEPRSRGVMREVAEGVSQEQHRQNRKPDVMQPYMLPPDTPLMRAKLADQAADRIQQEELERRTTLDGIHEELVESGIIPDVLPQTFQPEFNITLRFDSQLVQMGEVLTLNDTRHEPIIEFDSQPEQTFSVAIVDPDAPSMARHGYRSFRHFLVSNLDTKEKTVSNILTSYEPPQPAFGTGMHRYAVVVLKQLGGRFNVTDNDVPQSRVRFNVIDWGKEHNMKPVAASFFLVKRQHQNEHVDYN
ncbi:hypothetical protein H4R99_001438 [Coemansia sp. RSA 1722]|nr:hypothetical protein LPJ57_001390 [Coemansia sp. RSA 486]KAJ2236765.1 hypothetical protein IWW45_001503 [Coemansia sp. RSA 485]KAJ2605035.1 hypothetical protein H4R99_001438 [Coemansia sp. RSA 1722]